MNDIIKKDTLCDDDTYFSEEAFENYFLGMNNLENATPFEKFKAHRKQTLGKSLPIYPKVFLEEAEQKQIQDVITKIKSLSFFSNGYIDNLIIYFEALKNPFLSAEYLEEIIDRYIKPDIRVQGIKPFQKFAIGYFCYEMNNYNASIRALTRIMSKHFLISLSEIEKAIKDYALISEGIQKDKEKYLIADLLGIMILHQTDFDIEGLSNLFSEHHHAAKAKRAFLNAYDCYSSRIANTYVSLIKDDFITPPCLLDEIILPELKDYILNFDKHQSMNLDINLLAGIILSFTLLRMAPDLINDKEKLKKMGWIE